MKYLLLAVLAGSGAVLATRAFVGPFAGVHSPMNVEGIFALSWITLLLLRGAPTLRASSTFSIPAAAGLCLAVSAGFILFLDFPLLADDYSHIWNAHHVDSATLLAHFTVPEEDHFFRPVGYLSYAFDALWAGYLAATWRSSNLALHLFNTVLVLWLCIELGFSKLAAFGGALIFGLHGSGPEAVTWVAARFDLLAVLFGLGCVISVLRASQIWIGMALLLAAVMSKESAYITPFIVVTVLLYQGRTRQQIVRIVWPLIALEIVAFSYRTWLLNGIGGYQDAASGRPTVFNFGLASSLKALFLRFWAAMIFPMNWTGGLNATLTVSLCLAIAALGYLAWRGADRRKLLLGLAVATISSLPVQQFLSIGPDLEKSRVLYMASVGLAIMFAALFEGGDSKVYASAACIVLFQFVALESNLAVWKRVGYIAERACRVGADALRTDPRPLRAVGLPNVIEGVYFLHTGYPECVYFRLPEAVGRISLTATPAAQEYSWNETRTTLERR